LSLCYHRCALTDHQREIEGEYKFKPHSIVKQIKREEYLASTDLAESFLASHLARIIVVRNNSHQLHGHVPVVCVCMCVCADCS